MQKPYWTTPTNETNLVSTHCPQVRELEQEQSSWLDEQLEEAKSGGYKHVVVFQHIPWFLRDPGEEKEYFNIVLELRQKMLEKFHRAGECPNPSSALDRRCYHRDCHHLCHRRVIGLSPAMRL